MDETEPSRAAGRDHARFQKLSGRMNEDWMLPPVTSSASSIRKLRKASNPSGREIRKPIFDRNEDRNAVLSRSVTNRADP